MSSTASTTATVERARRARTPRRAVHPRSCSCGQQLDLCAHAHCPRCGRTLSS